MLGLNVNEGSAFHSVPYSSLFSIPNPMPAILSKGRSQILFFCHGMLALYFSAYKTDIFANHQFRKFRFSTFQVRHVQQRPFSLEYQNGTQSCCGHDYVSTISQMETVESHVFLGLLHRGHEIEAGQQFCSRSGSIELVYQDPVTFDGWYFVAFD
jgi:hypothetical protein